MASDPEVRAGVDVVDLSGTTALVTGSTDGVGRAAALGLGRLGATVLVHGRSAEKADGVVEAIEAAGGTARRYLADFLDLGAVNELADSVLADVGDLDLLVNNAATYFRTGRRSAVGAEATMTVNHLAPFLLTHLLRPAIPDAGRIVTTASEAHRGTSLDPDRIDEVDPRGFRAYSRSKLANILFTRELGRRLDGPTATCYHPGFIPGSGLWREAPLPIRLAMRGLGAMPDPVTELVASTPKSGAATMLYLAVSGAVSGMSGRYFAGRSPTEPSRTARDDELAEHLWAVSEAYTDLPDGVQLD